MLGAIPEYIYYFNFVGKGSTLCVQRLPHDTKHNMVKGGIIGGFALKTDSWVKLFM